MFLIFNKQFKIDFQKRKWNNPNRKWKLPFQEIAETWFINSSNQHKSLEQLCSLCRFLLVLMIGGTKVPTSTISSLSPWTQTVQFGDRKLKKICPDSRYTGLWSVRTANIILECCTGTLCSELRLGNSPKKTFLIHPPFFVITYKQWHVSTTKHQASHVKSKDLFQIRINLYCQTAVLRKDQELKLISPCHKKENKTWSWGFVDPCVPCQVGDCQWWWLIRVKRCSI